jgi:hypothetical protein
MFNSSLYQDVRPRCPCFIDIAASLAARALISHAAAIGIRMHITLRFCSSCVRRGISESRPRLLRVRCESSECVRYIRLHVDMDYMRSCRASIGFDHQMQEKVEWNVSSTLTLQTMIDLHLQIHVVLHVDVCIEDKRLTPIHLLNVHID